MPELYSEIPSSWWFIFLLWNLQTLWYIEAACCLKTNRIYKTILGFNLWFCRMICTGLILLLDTCVLVLISWEQGEGMPAWLPRYGSTHYYSCLVVSREQGSQVWGRARSKGVTVIQNMGSCGGGGVWGRTRMVMVTCIMVTLVTLVMVTSAKAQVRHSLPTL